MAPIRIFELHLLYPLPGCVRLTQACATLVFIDTKNTVTHRRYSYAFDLGPATVALCDLLQSSFAS